MSTITTSVTKALADLELPEGLLEAIDKRLYDVLESKFDAGYEYGREDGKEEGFDIGWDAAIQAVEDGEYNA